MRRPDRQCIVVASQVLGIVLFQAVDALQAIAGAVQDQRRQQAGCAPVAIIVGMDGCKLVTRQSRDKGGWKLTPVQFIVYPGDQVCHEAWHVVSFRRQIDNGP